MSNIFELKQTLLSIFDTIEENEGEITPELEAALAITEKDFNNKVEDYTNVIKTLEADLNLIKEEQARLKSLEKSKKNTIERLKTILIDAINTFGQTSKAGAKFIDYGTGKCSIRKSRRVVVDEVATSRFTDRLIQLFEWYKASNQLDNSDIDWSEVFEYINSKSEIETEENIELCKITESDASNITIDFNSEITIPEIIKSKEAFDLFKALINYNKFTNKTKISKTEIKADTENIPSFAKIETVENISIR